VRGADRVPHASGTTDPTCVQRNAASSGRTREARPWRP
jgi:hypothetical protein